MFIDSHLHLSKKYYPNIGDIVNKSNQNNVKKMLISCCSMDDLQESLEIVNNYDNIYLSVGLHPDQALNYTCDDLRKIEETALSNDKVIAIGEIGLDYYYSKDNKKLQIELFESQLKIAEKLGLSVVIHTRDAVADTLGILKKYKLKGVIHCFGGSYETACEYLKLGYKLGIGGVITFKNSKLYEVVNKIDLSDIILETDSPYLAPEPYRGTTNAPYNIPVIAQKIADVCNVDTSFVEEITTKTFNQLFDLE